MMDEIRARFDAGAAAWIDYNRTPLGRVRDGVTWENLLGYLPALDSQLQLRALDCGGGSGELALRLVLHGYHAWLLDYAPAMLNHARQAAQDLPQEARDRLVLCCLAAEEARHAFAAGFFDLVTCHTVVEYVADPCSLLSDLASLLCPGGIMSVTFVNRYAEILRQVWSHSDLAGGRRALEDGHFDATLFGLPGVAYTAEQVAGWLASAGLEVTATRGVRVFADYLPRKHLDDFTFFQDLYRLEILAASQTPLNLIARYAHLIALKPLDPCGDDLFATTTRLQRKQR